MGMNINFLPAMHRQLYIYVTGKLCNQAFHEMPKDSRHFAKSRIRLGFYHIYYTTCLMYFRQIVKYDIVCHG